MSRPQPIPIRPSWSDSDLELHGLPAAPDAERFVLGSLGAGWADVPAILDTLTAEDFSTEAHRRIYSAARALHDRGSHVDRITILHELRNRGQLESVGGISYVSAMDEGLPQIPDLTSYLRIIRDKSLRRQIIAGCHGLISRCISAPDQATDVLDSGEKLLADLSQESGEEGEFQTVEQIINAAGGTEDYVQRARRSGLMSQYADLNHYTHGWLDGELVIVAGLTSSGKSAFVENLAVHWARQGYPGAIFSTEMSSTENTNRLACIHAGIDHLAARRGEVQEFGRALGEVAFMPLYLYDKAYITIPRIASGLRRLKARKGIRWAVVDYLQQLSSPERKENRTQEVSSFSRGLKLIAQDLKIPLFAVSQLSRIKDTRKPELSDLRESGSIEQDANSVLFIHPKGDGANEWSEALLIIAKQRNGPKHKEIEMVFHGPSFRFMEAAV